MRSDDERALEEALAAAQSQADRIARAAGFIAGRVRGAGIDSAVEEIEAPSGDDVVIWSATDLMLDRLAQAVYGNAPERLEQALALRASAGDDFDVVRARQRAIDEGGQTVQVLDVFLRVFDALSDVGDHDDSGYDRARERFWSEIDSLGIRS